MAQRKGAANAAGKPSAKGAQASKQAAKAAAKNTANAGGKKGSTGKRSLANQKPQGFTIGDTPAGKAAIEAIGKNTGKKGSFWSNKAVKDIAESSERQKTKRTAFRSAAAASVATSYANNMDGGLQFASTANPTLDGSGNYQKQGEDGGEKKVVYDAGQR
jgi:hypothetical protein